MMEPHHPYIRHSLRIGHVGTSVYDIVVARDYIREDWGMLHPLPVQKACDKYNLPFNECCVGLHHCQINHFIQSVLVNRPQLGMEKFG